MSGSTVLTLLVPNLAIAVKVDVNGGLDHARHLRDRVAGHRAHLLRGLLRGVRELLALFADDPNVPDRKVVCDERPGAHHGEATDQKGQCRVVRGLSVAIPWV